MNQSRINLMIDLLGLLLFALLASTGFLMQFVLPPGTTRTGMVGGMNRHEWGQIHFWVAMGLLVVITLHLIMHWRWVVSMVLGKPGERRGLRRVIASAGVVVLIAALVWPLVVPVTPITWDVPHYAKSMRLFEESSDAAMISGNMTLDNLEVSTGVSAVTVWKELGLAEEPAREIPLKELSQRYGFSIQQIRKIVHQHQAVNQTQPTMAQEPKQRISR